LATLQFDSIQQGSVPHFFLQFTPPRPNRNCLPWAFFLCYNLHPPLSDAPFPRRSFFAEASSDCASKTLAPPPSALCGTLGARVFWVHFSGPSQRRSGLAAELRSLGLLLFLSSVRLSSACPLFCFRCGVLPPPLPDHFPWQVRNFPWGAPPP